MSRSLIPGDPSESDPVSDQSGLTSEEDAIQQAIQMSLQQQQQQQQSGAAAGEKSKKTWRERRQEEEDKKKMGEGEIDNLILIH